METPEEAEIVGTILVVEDSNVVRTKIQRMLKSMGHTVLAAEDGHKGLAMLRKHDVDIILLDIMMPDISGFEVLEIIRRDNGTAPYTCYCHFNSHGCGQCRPLHEAWR